MPERGAWRPPPVSASPEHRWRASPIVTAGGQPCWQMSRFMSRPPRPIPTHRSRFPWKGFRVSPPGADSEVLGSGLELGPVREQISVASRRGTEGRESRPASLRGGQLGQAFLLLAGRGRCRFEGPRAGEFLIVPSYHIFGSEELSALSPGIASLSPGACVSIHPEDAERIGRSEQEIAAAVFSEDVGGLSVRKDETIPRGVIAVPSFLWSSLRDRADDIPPPPGNVAKERDSK